eukprot:TRINITY_DN4462_c0_g2_i1.p1 TRINITY_DN4462_c0_g2~~TRINITY_DN4462_c0_g2_i1.p1  ORF type:complete len:396 (-),score=42.94 TRINITY_DN4462_c0_g2_i1:102-1289(-)
MAMAASRRATLGLRSVFSSSTSRSTPLTATLSFKQVQFPSMFASARAACALRCGMQPIGHRRHLTSTRPLSGGKEVYTPHMRSDHQNLLPYGVRTRSLVESRISGTLTTVTADAMPENQSPCYGSIMPYILDKNGTPIFTLRSESLHCQHLERTPQASLVVYSLTPQDINPADVALPRVNLTGQVHRLGPADLSEYIPKMSEDDETEGEQSGDGCGRSNKVAGHHMEAIRSEFLKVHPGAKPWIDELQFFCLRPSSVVLMHDMVKTDIATMEEYEDSRIDPIAHSCRDILNTINAEHRKELGLFCLEYGQTEVHDVFMYWADAYGFNLLGKTITPEFSADMGGGAPPQWADFRLPFPFQMNNAHECVSGITEGLTYLKNKHGSFGTKEAEIVKRT